STPRLPVLSLFPYTTLFRSAFVAVAQFAPGLIGGLYWQGASRQGVKAGLWVGFIIWIYTLLLPTLSESSWFDTQWIEYGPFGIRSEEHTSELQSRFDLVCRL